MRIIASTKRDLLEKIAAGTFRQDLYYRLDVMRVNIPPLRERREDIPLLAEHLLKRIAKDGAARLEPAAVEVLRRHDWPGNVRELSHVLAARLPGRLAARSRRTLLAELEIHAAQKRPAPSGPFQETIDKTERELLESALQAAGGNKSAAAAALGMKLSTFRDKLAKHGLA